MMNVTQPNYDIKIILENIEDASAKDVAIFSEWLIQAIQKKKTIGLSEINSRPTKVKKNKSVDVARDERVIKWCLENLEVDDIVQVKGRSPFRQITEIFPAGDYSSITGWKLEGLDKPKVGRYIINAPNKTAIHVENMLKNVVMVYMDNGWQNVNDLAKRRLAF